MHPLCGASGRSWFVAGAAPNLSWSDREWVWDQMIQSLFVDATKKVLDAKFHRVWDEFFASYHSDGYMTLL